MSSRSVLLQLVRDSIAEVFEATRLIDPKHYIDQYPILAQPIGCSIVIYLDDDIRCLYQEQTQNSLVENIIIGAKKAAFEDPNHPPLKTREYLHSTIELILHTQDGDISEKDDPIIKGDGNN